MGRWQLDGANTMLDILFLWDPDANTAPFPRSAVSNKLRLGLDIILTHLCTSTIQIYTDKFVGWYTFYFQEYDNCQWLEDGARQIMWFMGLAKYRASKRCQKLLLNWCLSEQGKIETKQKKQTKNGVLHSVFICFLLLSLKAEYNQLGRKRFMSLSRLQSFQKGSWGRNLKAGTNAEAMEELCLLTCSPQFPQPVLLYN